MNTRHCMLDLETLGTSPGAQIVSVGAVAFGPEGVDTERPFYARVLLPESLSVDRDTLEWWSRQSEAARSELFVSPRYGMSTLCGMLSDWWRARECVYVWCHGATFDAPLIEPHFPSYVDHYTGKRTGGVPWRYADVRDTRTLFQLAGLDLKAFRRGGDAAATAADVPHNALYDAVAQALAVCEAVRLLGVDWSRL